MAVGKFFDLTGQRFGRLVVIERAENRIYQCGGTCGQWKCQCDCGEIVIKTSQGLRSGKSKSCGCLRLENGNKPFLFMVDDTIKTKYSNFVILEQLMISRVNEKHRDKKYRCKCVDCGEEQVILEHTLALNIGSCRACSDKYSYPAKYFYWFLKQVGIDFDTEYSPKWLGRYRFDFHFVKNSKEYIVEVDGSQHYTHGHKRLTVDEVKAIDRKKENLALEHGISVIRLECMESKGKVIENEIREKLSDLFDMSSIDWKMCSYRAISNKYKKFCDLWNCGYRSTTEISEITGSSANYISKCLQECSFYGLCDYDPKEAVRTGARKSTNGKQIICLNTGEKFNSAQECSKNSIEKFGVFLKGSGITRVCRKERTHYKGFSFAYLEED